MLLFMMALQWYKKITKPLQRIISSEWTIGFGRLKAYGCSISSLQTTSIPPLPHKNSECVCVYPIQSTWYIPVHYGVLSFWEVWRSVRVCVCVRFTVCCTLFLVPYVCSSALWRHWCKIHDYINFVAWQVWLAWLAWCTVWHSTVQIVMAGVLWCTVQCSTVTCVTINRPYA